MKRRAPCALAAASLLALLWAGAIAGVSAQTPAPVPGTAPPPAAQTLGASGSAAGVSPGAAPGALLQGGPITRPLVRIGDEWIYRRVGANASLLLRQRVTDVNFDGISLLTESAGSADSNTAVYNREWGLLASGYNTYAPALAYYAFPLYPGKRWRIESAVSNFGAGQTSRINGEGRAIGYEQVETAAGKFVALKVSAEFETGDPGDASYRVKVLETHWYAREVLRPVRVESVTQAGSEAPQRETIELVRFKVD